MEKRNGVKLTALLVRYIVLCVVVGAAIMLLFWQMLTMAMTSGFVLSANTAERQAKAACEAMEQADSFDAALVPELCEYALFDETGVVVQTSLSDEALRAAQSYRATGVNSGGRFHTAARLQSGACVLQYTFGTQYGNPALRGKLPDAQLLFAAAFFGVVMLVLGGITLHTARRLKRSLQPLTDATNEMARGNLTWHSAPTGIAEYDDVLRAMQKLQTALGESLQAQWSMEHSRVAQMQALAHDLRTPLTVIDGNAQLLEETTLTPEQTECVTAIARAGTAAQDYVTTLRRIAGAEANAEHGAQTDTGMKGTRKQACAESDAKSGVETCAETGVPSAVKAAANAAPAFTQRDEMPPQTNTATSPIPSWDTVDTAGLLRELTQDARQICKVRGVRLAGQMAGAEGRFDAVTAGDAHEQAGECARGSAWEKMPQTLLLCAQEVQRAVGNLVQNAAEHSPQGAAVTLAFSYEAPLFKITVEDSGRGFSPQALAHATQPLFTEHTGRTPEGHLGLGLAVAQHTAQSHGGSVRLQNTKEGHGCVIFTLYAAAP